MITDFMNRRLLESQPSGIRTFTEMARGVPGCLLLTIGEPDFNTPEIIKNAAKKSLDDNEVHYSPWAGGTFLREKIASFEQGKGREFHSGEVLLTNGATEALYLALTGILNPGDEVIIPTPAFGLYRNIAELAGAAVVTLATKGPDFQIDRMSLEGCLSHRTKALVLNSPNNPTGRVYSQDTLEMIRDVLQKRPDFDEEGAGPVFVICDEVYSQLSYSSCPSFSQFRGMREQTLVVQSFSKPYAMTGWRAGYLLGDKRVVSQLVKLHANAVVSAVSFIQKACAAALDFDVSGMREDYCRRRDYVCGRLASMGFELSEPEGGFYVFPYIGRFGMDSEAFCTEMARSAKVALVPGRFFEAEGYARLSYCYSVEILKEGLDRMEHFVKRL